MECASLGETPSVSYIAKGGGGGGTSEMQGSCVPGDALGSPISTAMAYSEPESPELQSAADPRSSDDTFAAARVILECSVGQKEKRYARQVLCTTYPTLRPIGAGFPALSAFFHSASLRGGASVVSFLDTVPSHNSPSSTLPWQSGSPSQHLLTSVRSLGFLERV